MSVTVEQTIEEYLSYLDRVYSKIQSMDKNPLDKNPLDKKSIQKMESILQKHETDLKRLKQFIADSKEKAEKAKAKAIEKVTNKREKQKEKEKQRIHERYDQEIAVLKQRQLESDHKEKIEKDRIHTVWKEQEDKQRAWCEDKEKRYGKEWRKELSKDQSKPPEINWCQRPEIEIMRKQNQEKIEKAKAKSYLEYTHKNTYTRDTPRTEYSFESSFETRDPWRNDEGVTICTSPYAMNRMVFNPATGVYDSEGSF